MKSFNVSRKQLKGLGPIRYLKQLDAYCCGPIALLNCWKWHGHRVTLKRDFKRAAKHCRYVRPVGTYRNNITKALNKQSRKATWNQVKRALLDDKSIIVSTDHGDSGHIWFVPHILVGSKQVVAVNFNYGHTYTVLSYQMVVSLLEKSVCWVLTK